MACYSAAPWIFASSLLIGLGGCGDDTASSDSAGSTGKLTTTTPQTTGDTATGSSGNVPTTGNGSAEGTVSDSGTSSGSTAPTTGVTTGGSSDASTTDASTTALTTSGVMPDTTTGGSTTDAGTTDADASAAVDAGAGAAAEIPGAALARRASAVADVPAIAFAAFTRMGVVASSAVGVADEGRNTPATDETVFHAASIGKLIVATCVMQLVEAAKLDLDADVSAHVGFPVRHPKFPKQPITLRMLLGHRAAIRDHVDELRAAHADVALGLFTRRYLARDSAFLAAPPGAAMEYSNVGVALAAYAVERVSGEPFARFSALHVFEPLRMRSSGWSAVPFASPAVPYARREGRHVSVPHASHAVYPSADLYSTARDLARFARAVLGEGELEGSRILSPKSVSTMLRVDPDGGAQDQALAWQVRTIGSLRVAGHEGEDDGASTALFLDLAGGSGAVVLANGDAFGSGDAARAAAIQKLIADLLAFNGRRP